MIKIWGQLSETLGMKSRAFAAIVVLVLAVAGASPASAQNDAPETRFQLLQQNSSLANAQYTVRQSVHLGTITRSQAELLMQSDIDRHRAFFGLPAAEWIQDPDTDCQANADAAAGDLQHFRPGCNQSNGEILAAGPNRAPASAWLRSTGHRHLMLGKSFYTNEPVKMSASIACGGEYTFEAVRFHSYFSTNTTDARVVPSSNFSVACNGKKYELYVSTEALEVGFRSGRLERTSNGLKAVTGVEPLPASIDANGRIVLPRFSDGPVVKVGHTGTVPAQKATTPNPTEPEPTTPEPTEPTGEAGCLVPNKGSMAAQIDGDPASAQVFRLYSAFFLRAPNKSGFNYWTSVRREGRGLESLAWSFGAGAEFKNRYGNLSNREYVKLVFANVLCRTPDNSGLNYWTQRLDSGNLKRQDMIIFFSEGNEFLRRTGTRFSAL